MNWMRTFQVPGPVYSRLGGYFEIVAVPQQVFTDAMFQLRPYRLLKTASTCHPEIRLFKHLIKDISFWKWVLWTWRCFLLFIASPRQDTTSFYCLWHFRKYYAHCVCSTLCPFLHTLEALEQICTLQRILIEDFFPISDLLKKHYNLPIFERCKCKLETRLECCMRLLFLSPTPSHTVVSVIEAGFGLMQAFKLYVSVLLLSRICMFESFVHFNEALNPIFKSRICWKKPQRGC